MAFPAVQLPQLQLPQPVYRFYEKQLARSLKAERTPKHIGVTIDGNRRWAKQMGASTGHGHQAGADKILEFLGWCQELGVEVVTLYMLSTDNLNRSPEELERLLDIIAHTLDRLYDDENIEVHALGARHMLPEQLAAKLESLTRKTEDGTRPKKIQVNVAIGYGGRQEIADAVKELLTTKIREGNSLDTIAEEITPEQIAQYLYTRGQPDPDLIIRTSGEVRLSGFLMWQSAYSEFYFCEALWPAFRKVDFLRALRDYGNRERRFGA